MENKAWVPHGDSTLLTIETGAAGTYVVGASIRHSEIDLQAADFNEYLEHDGIPDVLEARHRDNELGKDVRERYSKHVKAVFQVGDARTDDFSAILGYPAEIVPLNNPYRRIAEKSSSLEGIQPMITHFFFDRTRSTMGLILVLTPLLLIQEEVNA